MELRFTGRVLDDLSRQRAFIDKQTLTVLRIWHGREQRTEIKAVRRSLDACRGSEEEILVSPRPLGGKSLVAAARVQRSRNVGKAESIPGIPDGRRTVGTAVLRKDLRT